MKRRSILVGLLSLVAAPAVASALPLEKLGNTERYVGQIIYDDDGKPRWILAANVQSGEVIKREHFYEIVGNEIKPMTETALPNTLLPPALARYCSSRYNA